MNSDRSKPSPRMSEKLYDLNMDMATALEARAMNEQRDEHNNLICPFIGCSTVIRALTGLQELQKMRQHFNRKHRR